MELAIGIAIGAAIGALFKRRKSHKSRQAHIETDQERKLRESDEIVTVILPTINHDK